jgi:hypothetical protein
VVTPFGYHRGWSQQGGLIELLGGHLGVVVLEPKSPIYPPCIVHLHIPLIHAIILILLIVLNLIIINLSLLFILCW